jgi:hypothetical protein
LVKDGVIRRLKHDPGTIMLLITFGCGGEGLNLTIANHVVKMDSCWSPDKDDQALGRTFRMGQEKEMIDYHFHVKGTVDDRKQEIAHDKNIDADQWLGGNRANEAAHGRIVRKIHGQDGSDDEDGEGDGKIQHGSDSDDDDGSDNSDDDDAPRRRRRPTSKAPPPPPVPAKRTATIRTYDRENQPGAPPIVTGRTTLASNNSWMLPQAPLAPPIPPSPAFQFPTTTTATSQPLDFNWSWSNSTTVATPLAFTGSSWG